MHAIPLSPKCFNTCSGMLLMPELLFALKACCNVLFSSSGVMWCWAGVATGVKVSSGSAGLWNSARLCSVNS